MKIFLIPPTCPGLYCRLSGVLPKTIQLFLKPSARWASIWALSRSLNQAPSSVSLSGELMFASVFLRTRTAPLSGLVIFASELDWWAATDLTFAQSWMEGNETLAPLFSGVSSFDEPVRLSAEGCAAARLFFFLGLFSIFVCVAADRLRSVCRSSASLLSFVRLLLQPSISVPVSSWLWSLNLLTHWELHACKGWC